MSTKVFLRDSQDKLMEGINLYADAVQSTLGPSGKRVIISKIGEEPFVTKDGVTVGNSIDHSDPIINTGIQMVKKVSSKMDTDSKDGTTTATVLCRALIDLAMFRKAHNPNFDENRFQEEMKMYLERTIEKIEEHKTIISIDDIRKIAMTSANNDKEIAELFQQAFDHAGISGYINTVESVTGKSFVSIVNGFVIDMGYTERKYANNPLTNFFEAKEAYVVIIDNEFTDKKEATRLIQYFNKKAKQLPLIIFAKNFSRDVERIIDFNNMDRTGYDICLIKNQLRNSEYQDLLDDISQYTGVEPFKNFDEFNITEGIAYGVVVKSGHTIFQASQSQSQLEVLKQYTDRLSEAAELEASYAEKEMMLKRISKLTNGITTIYIGGDSEIEIKEKTHRIDDALGSCKAALESGVVIGGGQLLYLIAKEDYFSEDARQGKKGSYPEIFYLALQSPFARILINSHHNEESIQNIISSISLKKGYNAKTRTFENLMETGVVDPAKTVINALKNAVSIATTILSTECLIVEYPQQNQ